jgi:hypothetical protein
MTKIKVVDLAFDDLLGVDEVAKELRVTDKVARLLMSQNIIKSTRINGYYTKRELLDKYKETYHHD